MTINDPSLNLDAAPDDHRQVPNDGVPNDNTSMLEVLRDYEEAGYSGQFSVLDQDTEGDTDGPVVLCHTCRARSAPESLAVVSMRRLEGASDPSDMLMLAVVTCPICATGGVLTMNYGPEASAAQAEVQAALRDRRGSGSLPADQTPPENDLSAPVVPPPAASS